MGDKYILDEDGQPELCDDLMRWAAWFEKADRIVMKTQIGRHAHSGVEISTVFLGLKYGDCLYKTMVFGGKLDGEQERYVTKKDAARGHLDMVKRVRRDDKNM